MFLLFCSQTRCHGAEAQRGGDWCGYCLCVYSEWRRGRRNASADIADKKISRAYEDERVKRGIEP